MRIGHGYDAHRLTHGRRLVLGGVEIPFDRGLAGHSDADVLLHAICDALLGACGLGDIGKLFPDSDARYAGISSRVLLRSCVERAAAAGWAVGNLDATVIAERPKLAPHITRMVDNIAADCSVAVDAVNIKATTTEGMGFPGRGEGIGAHAVVLLVPTTT